MSWSANAADETVKVHEYPYPRRRVSGPPAPGRYTTLEYLGVRRRAITRLAQRHRLTNAYRWLGPGPTLALVTGLLVIGVAAGIATALSKRAPDAGAWTYVLTNPAVVGPGVIAALALLLRPLLETRLTGRAAALQRVFADIQAGEERHPERFKDFARAVTQFLGAACARSCVIIEDLRRSDWLTQNIVLGYLDGDERPVVDEQVWIVFEHRDDPLVSVQLRRAGHAFHERHEKVRAHHYEQLLLDERERLRLVQQRRLPARAGYPRPVKFVISGEQELRPRDAAMFVEWRNHAGRGEREGFDTLDFLHLLAVTETSSGGAWFNAETLKGTMASHTREGGRWDVQQSIVGRKLLSRDVTQILQQLDTDQQLKLVMARQPLGVYEIEYSAALALRSVRGQIDLADPALCHLFWALYWHDRKRRDPGAIWIRKLAHHAREAGVPARFGLAEELGNPLLEAAVHAVRGYVKGVALTFSRSGGLGGATELPQLLAAAIELTEAATKEQPVADLRRAAWDAYSLLGDEGILRDVLKLETAVDAPQERPDPLHRLFVDTLAVDSSRADVMAVLPRLDRSAADFASVRAAWLALALVSASGQAPPRAQAALQPLEQQLPAVVQGAVARVEAQLNAAGAGVAVNVAIASLGCWCLAIAARAGRLKPSAAVKVLDDVYLLGKVLPRPDRRRVYAREDDGDFVREGLEQELLVVAGASAALLDPDLLSDDQRTDVDDVMREAAGLGSSATRAQLIEEIARRMGLTEFMWERLGFAQLRSFMSLRRAQFAVALGDELNADAYEAAVDLLFRESEQPGVKGLLARAIIAPAAGHENHTAGDLCRGIELALKGGVSAELAQELCVMALHISNVQSDVPREEMLKRLLEVGEHNGRRSLVDRWFAGLADHELANAFTVLANAVVRASAAPFVDPAYAAMRRRLEAASSESADRARRALQLFELDRELRTRADLALDETRRYWRRALELEAYQTAWAVHLLLDNGRSDEETVRLGIEVLEYQATRPPDWNTFFMAKSLVNIFNCEPLPGLTDAEREGPLAAAIAYVEAGYDAHARKLAPHAYRAALELLIKHKPEREGEYGDALEKFDRRYERETLKRFLLPAKQRGQHFAVIWHYVTNLAAWGLTAQPDTPTGTIVAMTQRQREAEVRRCLHDHWPQPFTAGPHGKAVSAEFLVAAYSLLETDLSNLPGLAEAHALVEDRARVMLDPLLELAIELPKLPATLQAVLERHREALDIPAAAAA